MEGERHLGIVLKGSYQEESEETPPEKLRHLGRRIFTHSRFALSNKHGIHFKQLFLFIKAQIMWKRMTFQEKNLKKISLSPTVTLINAERLKSLKNVLLIPPFPDSSQWKTENRV